MVDEARESSRASGGAGGGGSPVADTAAEVGVLASGAGLVARPTRATVAVRGAHRTDYLHRMLSQHVKGLGAGQAAYACVLTAEGRVLADPLLWVYDDHVGLDAERSAFDLCLPVLERYVITEDVTFEDVAAAWTRLALVGPGSPEVLVEAGATPPAPGRHVEVALAGAPARLLRWDLGQRPAFELAVAPGDLEACRAALLGAGARPVGPAAYDTARVDEGVPAWGAEIDARILPLEARLEERAISFAKGCFPGQEPVLMARHRGRPPSLLMRLVLEDGTPPMPGTALVEGGREVGRVTTAVGASLGRGPRGLGLVRHALAVSGGQVETADGRRVVLELPGALHGGVGG